jgi:SAM-dependent methyltransferase
MAKDDEINYISKVAAVEDVSVDQFKEYLSRKPFSDDRCGDYLMDIAQVMRLLPLPPARLLDIGVGSGWTSDLFARRGYEVVGLDISPDMIELTERLARPGLSFQICDYETGPIPTGFDIAVIYDSLHHAEEEYQVIKNIYASLNDGGILITIEPGAGHSTTADSLEVMRKYGTTEKDMPHSLQKDLMLRAGFGQVDQYVRLTQLPLAEISTSEGAIGQVRHALSLTYGSVTGLTTIAVARKVPATATLSGNDDRDASLLALSVVHDSYIHRTYAKS